MGGKARVGASPVVTKALRAISNEARLQILAWLREPRRHFGSQPVGSLEHDGVCVTLIQRKCRLGQSTTSQYLAQLLDAGLVTTKRVGQWTYYKRDAKAVRRLLSDLGGLL